MPYYLTPPKPNYVAECRSSESKDNPFNHDLSGHIAIPYIGTASDASGSIVQTYELNILNEERIVNPQYHIENYYVRDDEKVSLEIGTKKD